MCCAGKLLADLTHQRIFRLVEKVLRSEIEEDQKDYEAHK
jgi:hypothetical protein